MKALHEFICQKRSNRRQAPSLQADATMPMKTTGGDLPKIQPHSSQHQWSAGGLDATLPHLPHPPKEFLAEAVDHLCLTVI